MNFTVHKEKGEKIMANYISGCIGEKGKDDLTGLIWKEYEVLTRGKTCHLCQSVQNLPSNCYI